MKNKIRAGFLLLGILMVAGVQGAWAQQSDRKLNIFLDCKGEDCDADHIRQNITFVNYVHERKDADVHILVTSQSASAGKESQLHFIGLKEYANKDQVLKLLLNATDTESEHRQQFLQVLTLGLMRYVSETSLAQRVKIEVEDSASALSASRDSWNSWVMYTSAYGYASGEESFRYKMFGGSVSGSRITEQWKFNLGVDGNHHEVKYKLGDDLTTTSAKMGYGYNGRAIKSLGEHWGIGGGVIGERDTYYNLKPSLRISMAIEHNFFPYKESSDRSFTVLYFAGVTRLHYGEETIFGKLRESRFTEGVQVEFKKKRAWGDSSVSSQLSHFGYSDQYRVIVGSENTWRVAKGFAVNLSLDAKRVNDQLYLPKGDLSNEDILIRRRAQKTAFEYSLNIGATFTFGSIYNNTVNARLASAKFFSKVF